MPSHNITASSGAGGSISPAGVTSVTEGENQIYTIIPSQYYYVASVTVDGVLVTPPVNTYTFTAVIAPHTIAVTFAIPAATQAIVTILTLLQAGMTTGHSEVEDFYTMSWYIGDPLGLAQILTPAAAIIPTQPHSIVAQYEGEDTITETYSIRFYQPAYRTSVDSAEIAGGVIRLIAMREKARSILRTDPTFGSQFVTSKISVNPTIPVAGDGNAFRISEINLEIKRRALWGS